VVFLLILSVVISVVVGAVISVVVRVENSRGEDSLTKD
jgi:hypothetical protein